MPLPDPIPSRYNGSRSVSHAVDETVIRAVVDRFYETARQDPMLGPVFEVHVQDWPAHMQKMYGFWATVLLGEQRYLGNPMLKHAPVKELSGDHFARWLDLFEQTLALHCAPEDATAWIATTRRMGFAMANRLGLGERADLLP